MFSFGTPQHEEFNKLMNDMSLPTRKPTLWSLRNLSTQISLRSPRRLIRADTFRLRVIDVMIPETE